MRLLKWISFILGVIWAAFFVLNTAPESKVYSESKLDPKVMVLMYHDIAPEHFDSSQAAFTAKQFKDHLQSLRDGGYTIITMKQFQKFMSGEETVSDRSVLLTFDDGYQSFYQYAYPVLKEMGATASVFVIGASTDLFNPDALPHLTWDEMKELKEAGMGIFSHTYNAHRYVKATATGVMRAELSGPVYLQNQKRMETKAEFRKRVRSDLAFMEKRLSEELGESDGLLAIPFGIYDKIVLEEGRKAGISLFFTTKEGINRPGREEIFRINAGKPDFSGKELLERIHEVEKRSK